MLSNRLLTIDLNDGDAENLRGAKALAEATRATRTAMISCIFFEMTILFLISRETRLTVDEDNHLDRNSMLLIKYKNQNLWDQTSIHSKVKSVAIASKIENKRK